MAEKVEERVTKIIAEQLGVDEGYLTPDKTFGGDLDADSLELIEAVMGLELEFGIDIPDDEIAKLETVAQAIELVRRLTA
ncbi:acyl carrier protein [Achromobacter sp. GG226]|uniref:acyl carrier protein n=1 Tax=Verticiella alkaliphila TaxID=2779529 RepID=UPI001C0D40DF|nr:acyl carrier protein [Verticiella sp. GG226]MBU4609175.1 acyl carrier protein [Verticiella sp. GG226]